jgi:hypothetical protein
VLVPLSTADMPMAEPPPRDSRFGSPLKLAKVHGEAQPARAGHRPRQRQQGLPGMGYSRRQF